MPRCQDGSRDGEGKQVLSEAGRQGRAEGAVRERHRNFPKLRELGEGVSQPSGGAKSQAKIGQKAPGLLTSTWRLRIRGSLEPEARTAARRGPRPSPLIARN